MHSTEKQLIIRQAVEADARAIAEILVEDWQTAYRGIIDDADLNAMSAAERYRREVQRVGQYVVAEAGGEVVGFAWNEMDGGGAADCEIIALYVRRDRQNSGIGRALFQHAADTFRAAGKRAMIVWCLRDNHQARRFYERMGGKVAAAGTHRWGGRDYEMISYLYRLDG